MTQYLQCDIPCAVFNMLNCLLSHRICLEKSTAAYFQSVLGLLPLCRRRIDWPQIETRQTVTAFIWLSLLKMSLRLIVALHVSYVNTLQIISEHFRRAEVSVSVKFVSSCHTLSTWWRMSILVFNHKTAIVVPLIWFECFSHIWPHIFQRRRVVQTPLFPTSPKEAQWSTV